MVDHQILVALIVIVCLIGGGFLGHYLTELWSEKEYEKDVDDRKIWPKAIWPYHDSIVDVNTHFEVVTKEFANDRNRKMTKSSTESPQSEFYKLLDMLMDMQDLYYILNNTIMDDSERVSKAKDIVNKHIKGSKNESTSDS